MCKVNIASFVRRIMPQTDLSECLMDDLTLCTPVVMPTVIFAQNKEQPALVLDLSRI